MNNGKYAVRCVGASKRFRSESQKGIKSFFKPEYITAVENVTIEVERGEIFGVIGPNGSGKSTLIRMLSTLLLPDSGYLEVFGKNVVEHTLDVRKLINRVSVDASFFKKLSVSENLSYAARLYGVPKSEALEKARGMLKNFGLEEKKMKQSVENLSRGQQQMVSIVRSLLSKPNLLLLDEPTTGLDPKNKKQVQEFILNMRCNHDTTVVLTSHDMDEVEKMCRRIAFIREGKIWACGTSDDLKSKAEQDNLENVFLSLTGEAFPEDENNNR